MTINNTTFEMTSSNSTRIYLPCQINEDLRWETAKALFESGKDIEDIASINAYVVPHVSPVKPLISYRLEITTTDGQSLVKHLKADFTPEQTTAILDSFFSAGAQGLAPNMCKLYQGQHRQYKSRNHSHKQAA